MPPPILISTSDFQKIREEQGLYVDKSDFIIEVLRRPAEAQLYPRPRRFGKTTSMSALRYFLEKGEDRSALFSDLKVWQDPKARQHFQRHAVINLSFKDVKGFDWADTRTGLRQVIQRELGRLEALWTVPAVRSSLAASLARVMRGEDNEQWVLL
ncbi:MAG TPA: AAA family ATPase, partial [Myxococcota bacterium]|nr:AAA family ATPase [Myxococcota bacterium]